jgi:hypothetical protein
MECRRESAREFLELSGYRRVWELDEQLHLERLGPRPRIDEVEMLPHGVIFAVGDCAYCVRPSGIWQWGFEGYRRVESLGVGVPFLLTPSTTVEVLRRGYRLHEIVE